MGSLEKPCTVASAPQPARPFRVTRLPPISASMKGRRTRSCRPTRADTARGSKNRPWIVRAKVVRSASSPTTEATVGRFDEKRLAPRRSLIEIARRRKRIEDAVAVEARPFVEFEKAISLSRIGSRLPVHGKPRVVATAQAEPANAFAGRAHSFVRLIGIERDGGARDRHDRVVGIEPVGVLQSLHGEVVVAVLVIRNGGDEEPLRIGRVGGRSGQGGFDAFRRLAFLQEVAPLRDIGDAEGGIERKRLVDQRAGLVDADSDRAAGLPDWRRRPDFQGPPRWRGEGLLRQR